MELTLEEMDREAVEYLPPREVMWCCRPCGCEPHFELEVELEVSLCI